MNFLKEAQRVESGQTARRMIAEADAAIVTLNRCKDGILSLRDTMANNTADFTQEDLAAFDSEIGRLAALIEAIV